MAFCGLGVENWLHFQQDHTVAMYKTQTSIRSEHNHLVNSTKKKTKKKDSITEKI